MSEAVGGDQRVIYARAGFTGSYRLGTRPAVVVVDLILGFTDPTSRLASDVTGVVRATRRLLDAARTTGAPVFFACLAFEPGLGDAGVWLQKVPSLRSLTIGSRWVDIDPRLDRGADEPVLHKRGASAFAGTPLCSLLAARRVDTVIVAGVTTSGCVRATAVDSMQNGYPTLVPRQCVGDRAEAPHAANLFDIHAKYADVVELPDVISYLQTRALPEAAVRVDPEAALELEGSA